MASNDNLTILTIDDKMITSELDKAGYRKIGVNIKSATNFQDAERILKNGGIDIVVINDDFKEINGLAILQHFKKQEETKGIPFVFTSVRSKPQKFKELTSAGMDLFVEQPIPRQYFIEKLRALLDQKTRDDNRFGFDGDVKFRYKDREMACTVRDISKTGLLLVASEELEVEVSVEMTFVLPHARKPIRVSGTIVRKMESDSDDEHLAYGIRFDKFEGDSRKRLEKYIGKTNLDDPKLVYYL